MKARKMLEHVVIWGYIDILVVAEKEFVSEWENEDSTSGYQPYEAEITVPTHITPEIG